MTVEVERKFVCSPDVKDKLTKIGAVCVGQCSFEDKYFDSPDYNLTLRDVWLRCRQGSWELKCPLRETGDKTQENDLCSRYREITNLPEIVAKVREVLKRDGDDYPRSDHAQKENKHRNIKDAEAAYQDTRDSASHWSDQSWLSELGLVPFAVFATQRCSFTFKEDDDDCVVRVDLDQADFGFCVGEIEVLVSDGDEMQTALEKIERTAQRLGLSGDKKVPGKMVAYLQRFCPDHYAKLLDTNIL